MDQESENELNIIKINGDATQTKEEQLAALIRQKLAENTCLGAYIQSTFDSTVIILMIDVRLQMDGKTIRVGKNEKVS